MTILEYNLCSGCKVYFDKIGCNQATSLTVSWAKGWSTPSQMTCSSCQHFAGIKYTPYLVNNLHSWTGLSSSLNVPPGISQVVCAPYLLSWFFFDFFFFFLSLSGLLVSCSFSTKISMSPRIWFKISCTQERNRNRVHLYLQQWCLIQSCSSGATGIPGLECKFPKVAHKEITLEIMICIDSLLSRYRLKRGGGRYIMTIELFLAHWPTSPLMFQNIP